MIHNHRDADQLVYHYTRVGTAIDYILPTRALRFNPYTYTNDPKESTSWSFDLFKRGLDGISDAHDLGELSQWLSAELKHRTKVFCCTRDMPPLTGDHIREIFNRGFCKPRMWAQYADDFTGVCLVLNRVKLEEAIRNSLPAGSHVLVGEVGYENRGIGEGGGPHPFCIDVDWLERLGRGKYPDWHLKNYFKGLFFEKARDWRDECEVRWVMYSAEPEFIHFDIQEVLVGIIHGHSTPSEAIDKIMSLTAGWSVEHQRLIWKNASPWYEYYDRRFHKR